MDDQPREVAKAKPSLATAMRRARIEDAERSDVVAELRGAELARLEMLKDALEPVLAQVPAERRGTLVARPTAPGVWSLDIRLQGEGETVFLEV